MGCRSSTTRVIPPSSRGDGPGPLTGGCGGDAASGLSVRWWDPAAPVSRTGRSAGPQTIEHGRAAATVAATGRTRKVKTVTDDLVIQYAEPWRETETFLRLLPGPRFSTPPTDENGVVIRHYSTTVSRNLRDHPKMRVDLSDGDDREIVARRVWRSERPA